MYNFWPLPRLQGVKLGMAGLQSGYIWLCPRCHRAFPILRVAWPTDNLVALLRYYRDGLASADSHGFCRAQRLRWRGARPSAGAPSPGIHAPGHAVGRAPTADNLLVFYLPEAAEWQVAVQRMQAAGFAPGPF